MLQPEDESSTDLSMVRKEAAGRFRSHVRQGLWKELDILGVMGAEFVDSTCDHGLFKLSCLALAESFSIYIIYIYLYIYISIYI